MKRSQTGSPFGTSRSTAKKRRLIKYAQRPGPYHAVQGGVLNPHKYPSYVIGTNPNLIASDLLYARQDTGDGDNINPSGNLILKVTMGVNQVLTAGITIATISGTAVSNASNDTPYIFLWTKVSGPGTPVIATPSASTTNITGLAVGVTVFKLSVQGKTGDTGSGTISITAS